MDRDANTGQEIAEADDGEFGQDDEDEDDFQVTDAERARDRDLAISTSVATLTGLASLASAGAGAAATAVGPIATAIATWAVIKLGRRRVEHAADTLMDAADAADSPLGEFIDRAVADDRRHELFARTLSIAQDTALREKRRALGRALAAGVMSDDARINEELLFIRAVEDIDEFHIRLLARMANTYPPGVGPGWNALKIVEVDSGLANGVAALLGTLELHGLIQQVVPGRPIQGEGAGQAHYNITQQGREFLERLTLTQDPG